MTISERVVAGVTILDIHGPLLEDTSDDFCDSVRPLILDGHTNVVINLHDVPYIDSTSLGEIMRAYTTATRLGGTVKLLQVGPRVRELLITTRLSGVLVSFDSEDDAVRSFGSTST
jgi:anti-anti-sigma factor